MSRPVMLSTEELRRIVDGVTKIDCGLIHPGFGCMHSALDRTGIALRRALRFYLPVYLIPTLVFRIREVYKKPVKEISESI
jgi:hypothetical protein